MEYPEVHIVSTVDGSHTLELKHVQEHYHSVNGAIQEAEHVFINAGYNANNISPVRVLEVGFGTGLNAMLTLREAEHQQRVTYYESIELYPLPDELTTQLNYAEKAGLEKETYFTPLHACAWDEDIKIAPYFTLNKRNTDVRLFTSNCTYNIIYFDAFAPTVQPELWSESVFTKLYGLLAEEGILVTYSSKGTVKEALRKAGFEVKRLPGANGKRHMLKAYKK